MSASLGSIGKYELLEYLGGGMADVYRARDTFMGRSVAIKILKTAFCEDADARTRFLQEARVAGSLNHENIVRVYDFGEDPARRPFLIMEYLVGQDIAAVIRQKSVPDLKARLRIATGVAAALEHIHSRGIIHRDIKPDNIFLTDGGEVKLMDFGIARQGASALTRAGFVIGTPSYMAPEQIRGEQPTKLVDVYAFGVFLFELIAWRKAFEGPDFQQVFWATLNEPLALDPLREQGASEQMVQFIARCAARDPAQRPPDFAEVRGLLCGLPEWTLGPSSAPSIMKPAPAHPRVEIPLEKPAFETGPAARIETAGRPAGASVLRPARAAWMIGAVAAVLLAVLGILALKKAMTVKSSPIPDRIQARGGEMVLVPAGTFLTGKTGKPETLPAYYIDRTEVTNAAYAAFARETGRALPDGFRHDQPEFPVVDVTFDDATAFAAWAGKRLPNSKEWEKAARGTDGRRFPWGEIADSKLANVAKPGGAPEKSGVVAVSAFESGKSPFGALHMLGNVSEWVAENQQPTAEELALYSKTLKPPARKSDRWALIRGGSYREPLDSSSLWKAQIAPARYRSRQIGFRCVKDVASPR